MKPSVNPGGRRSQPFKRALLVLPALAAVLMGGHLPSPQAKAVGASLKQVTETASDESGDWFTDNDAGLRFRVPFKPFITKTGVQVQALILNDPKQALPEGVRYTSGVYNGDIHAAPPAVPYVLVWTHADAQPPTQAALDDWGRAGASLLPQAARRFAVDELRFDAQTMRGLGRRAEGSGLRSRFLMQVARGSTVFVSLVYGKAEDAALFDVIAASFVLMPDRILRRDELRAGAQGRSAVLTAATSALFVLALVLLRRRGRRLGQGPVPLPASATGPASTVLADP